MLIEDDSAYSRMYIVHIKCILCIFMNVYCEYRMYISHIECTTVGYQYIIYKNSNELNKIIPPIFNLFPYLKFPN